MSRAAEPGGAPVVIYIAGSGRSGSTLVERAIGGMPGFVNVGELVDVFRRDAPHTERCGCGQPVGECPYWSKVGERAFGGWDSAQLAAVERLKGKIGRQRQLPKLLAPRFAGADFRADISRYGQTYENFYRAIAHEAGADCVVDASKWPPQAMALRRAGIDIRVIHLIRDVRGVAYSLSKQGVRRPHALDDTEGSAEVMWNKRPSAAATRWVARQAEVELMRRSGLPVTRMRYEDFVRDPRRAVERALAGLGISFTPSDLAHLGEGRATLGPSHGIAGNPSRFSEGEITLRADEAWRDRMAPRDRRLVTAIGLPLMTAYGWRRRG